MPTKQTKKDAGEQARLPRTANEVLEIYSDGLPDPWKRVGEKYPDLPRKGRTGPRGGKEKFNAETVLTWAAGIVAGDQVKQAVAARMFQAIAAIALDTKGRPTVRLSALKRLRRECGMVTGKAEAGHKPPAKKMRFVIVEPKNRPS